MSISRKEIEEVVCNIMRKDGPDGHVDGYDVIADFVMAVEDGDFYRWKQVYYAEKSINND